MSDSNIGRRAFLQGAGLAALSVAGIVPLAADEQYAAPNSTGTERAKLKAPVGSCDCHHHIYDPRFPAMAPPTGSGKPEPNATVADYRLLRRRIGTTRSVVVTPGTYLTDNSVTIDAISQFAPDARGQAVVLPSVTDAELKKMHDGGIRGIRFVNPAPGGFHTIDMIEPLAKRVNALGWHVDVNLDADHIMANEDLWSRLPTPLVFDHMARFPVEQGTQHPAFAMLRKLIDKGRIWVKLSFGERDSKVGPPTYSDISKVAQAWVQAAPERLIWGSNWPHPGGTSKADDALVFDLLEQWAPNARTRRRILVENPETLFGFAKSA
jgi:predicted TIM-barrel fold metal-dependent hydrolase